MRRASKKFDKLVHLAFVASFLDLDFCYITNFRSRNYKYRVYSYTIYVHDVFFRVFMYAHTTYKGPVRPGTLC